MVHLRAIWGCSWLVFSLGCQTPRAAPSADERVVESARAVVSESPTRSVGFVSVDAEGVRTHWLGAQALKNGVPLDEDTQFEIGSVSKVFAALLLADAEQRGEAKLDDPIAAYLPDWKLPDQAGQAITFRHALTHTLGIADMMPSNWVPVDAEHGVTRYTEDMFRDYLAGYTLVSTPGERYAYTNVGSSLIALALRQRTGKTYSGLLHDRIFQPLGMRRSGYADVPLPDAVHVLDGYEEDETLSTRRIDVSPIGPSCVIRSSLRDMGHFIVAALHNTSPLTAAFARLSEREPNLLNNGKPVALGWNIDDQRHLLRKNGQVAGYRCDLVLSPRMGKGMFIIVNSMRSDIKALSDAVLGALWPELAK